MELVNRERLLTTSFEKVKYFSESLMHGELKNNYLYKTLLYYDCLVSSTTSKCQILQKPFSNLSITITPIWTCKKYDPDRNEGIETFNLTKADVYHPRNHLVLHHKISEAFTMDKLCFLWDSIYHRIHVKVIDETIYDDVITDNVTFRDIDMHVLYVPTINNKARFPFRRLLSFHATCVLYLYQKLNFVDVARDENVQSQEDHIINNMVEDGSNESCFEDDEEEDNEIIKLHHQPGDFEDVDLKL